MIFNPIKTAEYIDASFKDYIFNTFVIRDEELRKQYKQQLEKGFEKGLLSKGPYLDNVDAFESGKSLAELIAEGLASCEFRKVLPPSLLERPLYVHQEEAFKTVSAGNNTLITTGTGSGKTECFLFPILNDLFREKEQGTLCPGVRTLLLYPMNALANDQMKRLREILENYPDITFAAFTGETRESEKEASEQFIQSFGHNHFQNELISREQIRQAPPNILVTNYAMLEYLLLRPRDNVFFDGRNSNYWRHIVLDEAHVYSGATGMEVSMLMRRVFHRIKNNDKLSFVLTSATLGEKDKNPQICSFASNLCAGTIFKETCIVRAKRKLFERPEKAITSPAGWFEDVSALLENYIDKENEVNKSKILDSFKTVYPNVSDSGNIHEMMYECLSHESLLYDVKASLAKSPKLVKDLARDLGRSDKDIIGLIRLASYANRDGSKLMDARYHHFIRTLEGAYVSFYPTKTLTLTSRNCYEYEGTAYLCFMVSVCQFCGTIYLIGDKEIDTFIQDQSRMKHKRYYMVVEDESFFKNQPGNRDFRESAEFIDCRTGKMRPYKPFGKNPEEIIVIEAKTNKEGIVSKCMRCETQSGIRENGIIRGFYLGQDASCSVVCDSLYEQVPEREIKRSTNAKKGSLRQSTESYNVKRTRNLLSFADSRQEAAFFASYLQYTHDKIAERRLLIEAIRKAEDSSFNTVFRYLVGLLRRHEFETPTSKAMLIILSELGNFTRNNLINTGWIRFKLKKEFYFESEEEHNIGDQQQIAIKGAQLNDILDFIVGFIAKQGAIYYSDEISFTENDLLEFSYSGKQPVIKKINTENPYNGYAESYLIPSPGHSNSILEFVQKQGFTIEEARTVIEKIVEEFFIPDTVTEGQALLKKHCHDSRVLVLDSSVLEFEVQDKTPFKIYKCSLCNRLSTIRGNLRCPTYGCNGLLREVPFEDNTYFTKQYDKDRQYLKMTVKEHTAQLGKEKAKEYQQDFIDGKINILSCSTTFEMGVDVGNLETVFMKNMPPKPSNYIQRAGRAGRRIDSAAFALTFCRLASHDFYFFERPINMIKGIINPPSFKIDNPKIVFRHMYSILLNAYWKDLFPQTNDVFYLFNDPNSFDTIKDYLLNRLPEETKAYIKKVVPESLESSINDEIRQYATNALPTEKEAYTNTIRELEDERKKIINRMAEGETKLTQKLKFIEKATETFKDQKIIDFYSRKNLLPKYGFPVDTVELHTELYDSTGTLSLQRDLVQAITEYAPDSEIIADGKIYRSRYILKPRSVDKTWTIHVISECADCGHISVSKIFTGDEQSDRTSCTYCGAPHSVSRKKMILPINGFETENGDLEIAKTRRPFKERRSDFYYIGNANPKENENARVFKLNGHVVRVLTSSNDELLVMNKSEFFVCEKCGFATTRNRPKDHNNKKAEKCNGTFGYYKLGHEFRTDVVLLHFDCGWMDINRIRTVMYALLKGASIKYDISEDDIDGCISYSNYIEGNPSGFNIILFDSIPGGAGNVKRIADSSEYEFRDYIEKCYEIVKNCSCGNEDGDSSCYSCLRSYKNQFYHQIIKRKYAIEFLGKLLGLA